MNSGPTEMLSLLLCLGLFLVFPSFLGTVHSVHMELFGKPDV